MAYVSRLADYARGGVVGEDMAEGTAVKMTVSGLRADLPVFMKASTNQTKNIGILIKGPDDFSRPTRAGMYIAPAHRVVNFNSGFSTPVHTDTFYDVGKSVLWNPTLVSGELGVMMRGGTFAVPSGLFIDSANIRVPGNMIRVGSDALWEYTATESQAVGFVEEYNTTNDVLIFTLHQ